MSYNPKEYEYDRYSKTIDEIIYPEVYNHQREVENRYPNWFSRYFNLHEYSPGIHKAINFILKTLGSSAIGTFLALALTCIVIVGLLAFAANPITAPLLPLLPVIFITVAWAAAGISAGIGAFITAIQHIKMHNETTSTIGWLGLGVGLMGTFATTGAVVGTFIPVPVLGTLVGAASGAVMGVLAGAAAWAVSGIVAGIVSAYKNRRDAQYDRVDDIYSEHYENNSEYVEEAIEDISFCDKISNKFTKLFSPETQEKPFTDINEVANSDSDEYNPKPE